MKWSWWISICVHASAMAGLAMSGIASFPTIQPETPIIISTDLVPEKPELYYISQLVVAEPEVPEPDCALQQRSDEPAYRNSEPILEVPSEAAARPPVAEELQRPIPVSRLPRPARPQEHPAARPVVAGPRPVQRPPQPAAGNRPPRYPMTARQDGLEGTVRLMLRVSKTGAVESVELVESSGHSQLDAAALAAIRRWRFAPAMRDGQPVAWELLVPVTFVLETARG